MKNINLKNFTSVFIATIFAIGALSIFACGSKKEAPTGVAPEPDERITVRAAEVETRTASLPVTASGTLTSTAEQRLSFKIGGVITRILVEEGANVRAGQLLATLDKTEIDAQVSQAEQALAKAERDLARVQGLYRDSSATLEMVENATTGRDVAKESARIARFNQQYAEIRATKSGRIIKKLMNQGEIAGPGMPVFVLFETGADNWVVQINASDRDWARLNLGMKASIHFDAYPNTEFTGTVSELAVSADPASGLYPVEIRVSPQGKRFAPGLFAQVMIQTGSGRPYATIPIEALIEGDGKQAFVYAPNGNQVQKIAVEVAYLDGKTAIIARGLEGVSQVITYGAPYLNEKKKIQIIQ